MALAVILLAILAVAFMFLFQAYFEKKSKVRDLTRAISWAEEQRPFIEKLKPENYSSPIVPKFLPFSEKPSTINDKNYFELEWTAKVSSSPYFVAHDK